MTEHPYIRRMIDSAAARNLGEEDFLDELFSLYGALAPCLRERPQYAAAGILERLSQPEQAVVFPVLWRDGRGRVRQNRGFYIRYSAALGPCRPDLIFREDLDLSSCKALALATTLQRSLAGLPMGGAIAGADADTSGFSDRDCHNFCAAFMDGVYPLLPTSFHPAAWAGQVHGRELGYLAGEHERLSACLYTDAIPPWAPGPFSRPKAAGYGLVYFAQCALRRQLGIRLEGQSILIYGRDGTGAWAGEKAARLGAAVTAIGDETGTLCSPGGLPAGMLRGMAAQPELPLLLWALRSPGVEYRPGQGLWDLPADVVFLCGGVISADDAGHIAAHRPLGVFEGVPRAAGGPAAGVFQTTGILFSPGIASGAGGAALSCRQRQAGLSRWEADRQLRAVMEAVFRAAWSESQQAGYPGDLAAGARMAAFRPIAEALLEKGAY